MPIYESPTLYNNRHSLLRLGLAGTSGWQAPGGEDRYGTGTAHRGDEDKGRYAAVGFSPTLHCMADG